MLLLLKFINANTLKCHERPLKSLSLSHIASIGRFTMFVGDRRKHLRITYELNATHHIRETSKLDINSSIQEGGRDENK